MNVLRTQRILDEILSKNIDITSKTKKLIVCWGLLGDFDTIEYAQLLSRNLQLILDSNIEIICFGIGKESSKKQFSEYTKLSERYIKIVNNSDLHYKLELNSGLSLGLCKWIDLLCMCLGISSPGTLNEVLRGYCGDSKSKYIFSNDHSIRIGNLINIKGSIFRNMSTSMNLLPFELATRRLENMIEVLSNLDIYISSPNFLTQRGGTFLLNENNQIIYSYRSNSLLGYSSNMSSPLEFLSPWLSNNISPT